MKQVILQKSSTSKSLFVPGLVLICLIAFTSCGTIANGLTGGKRPTFLVNAPADVKLKLDGKELAMESELFTSTEYIGSTVSKNYYTTAVNIPFKKAITLEISSSSMGKTAMLSLTPKRQGAIFWGNLLFFPIVGHIIDGVTDNNKVLNPKYIDVTSALNNVPMKDWPSQATLQKQEKAKSKLTR